jgi:hypothetical protein
MSNKRDRSLILLTALAFIALNLIGLDRSPVVWLDQVTLNDPAKELAINGQCRSSVFAELPEFAAGYYGRALGPHCRRTRSIRQGISTGAPPSADVSVRHHLACPPT